MGTRTSVRLVAVATAATMLAVGCSGEPDAGAEPAEVVIEGLEEFEEAPVEVVVGDVGFTPEQVYGAGVIMDLDDGSATVPTKDGAVSLISAFDADGNAVAAVAATFADLARGPVVLDHASTAAALVTLHPSLLTNDPVTATIVTGLAADAPSFAELAQAVREGGDTDVLQERVAGEVLGLVDDLLADGPPSDGPATDEAGAARAGVRPTLVSHVVGGAVSGQVPDRTHWGLDSARLSSDPSSEFQLGPDECNWSDMGGTLCVTAVSATGDSVLATVDSYARGWHVVFLGESRQHDEPGIDMESRASGTIGLGAEDDEEAGEPDDAVAPSGPGRHLDAELLTLVEPRVYRGYRLGGLVESAKGGAEWLFCQPPFNDNDDCADFLYDWDPDVPGLQLVELATEDARRPVVAVNAASDGPSPVAEYTDSYGVGVEEARSVARMLDIYSTGIEPAIMLTAGVPRSVPNILAKRDRPEDLKRESRTGNCSLSGLRMTPERALEAFNTLLTSQIGTSSLGEEVFWEDTAFLERADDMFSDTELVTDLLQALTGCDLLELGGSTLMDALPSVLTKLLPGAGSILAGADWVFGAQAAVGHAAMYHGWNTDSHHTQVLTPLLHGAIADDPEALRAENRRAVDNYDWTSPTIMVTDRAGGHESLATLRHDRPLGVAEIWNDAGTSVEGIRADTLGVNLDEQPGSAYHLVQGPLPWSAGDRAGAYLMVERYGHGTGELCLYSYVASHLTVRLEGHWCEDDGHKWQPSAVEHRYAWRVDDAGRLEQWARESFRDHTGEEPWTEGEPYLGPDDVNLLEGRFLSFSGEYWRFDDALTVERHDHGEGLTPGERPVPWPAGAAGRDYLTYDSHEASVAGWVSALESGEVEIDLCSGAEDRAACEATDLQERVRAYFPPTDPWLEYVDPACLSALSFETGWSEDLCGAFYYH